MTFESDMADVPAPAVASVALKPTRAQRLAAAAPGFAAVGALLMWVAMGAESLAVLARAWLS